VGKFVVSIERPKAKIVSASEGEALTPNLLTRSSGSGTGEAPP